MNLLDDIFEDLIDDINIWKKRNYLGTTKERLENLKDILDGQTEMLDDAIKEIEQDKSWAGVDEAIEKEKIENYEG